MKINILLLLYDTYDDKIRNDNYETYETNVKTI